MILVFFLKIGKVRNSPPQSENYVSNFIFDFENWKKGFYIEIGIVLREYLFVDLLNWSYLVGRNY